MIKVIEVTVVFNNPENTISFYIPENSYKDVEGHIAKHLELPLSYGFLKLLDYRGKPVWLNHTRIDAIFFNDTVEMEEK